MLSTSHVKNSRSGDEITHKSQSQRRLSHRKNSCTRLRTCAKKVTVLDYGAGNVLSLRNALKLLECEIETVETAKDILNAETLIFPGVGAFESAMSALKKRDLVNALRDYVQAGEKPFLGICLGLQVLFEGSEEFGGCEGLGIIPGTVCEFPKNANGVELQVPHIGWNNTLRMAESCGRSDVFLACDGQPVYFVHSFRAIPDEMNKEWIACTCTYGEEFIASVSKGQAIAVQFHPEKSGGVGIQLLKRILKNDQLAESEVSNGGMNNSNSKLEKGLAKRIIACLDVRANDAGDLVVTKGDQYDVREQNQGRNEVRNMGKPVDLATRYFSDGADEIAILNITGFRDCPLSDLPMLELLRRVSEKVFVPLTLGGGIRDFVDSNGVEYSALDIANAYFRSGADKISIGGDAVFSAEEYYVNDCRKTGNSSIEKISEVYGKQAVVVSIDPKRVYVHSPEDVKFEVVKLDESDGLGPNGERYCWYQCTVKGGREGRPIGAVELAKAVEALGAGEILLNCIDRDGTNSGFDIALMAQVSGAVSIPVIASSGAGMVDHFVDIFQNTNCSAALAAGIFHRNEVAIADVKERLAIEKFVSRL